MIELKNGKLNLILPRKLIESAVLDFNKSVIASKILSKKISDITIDFSTVSEIDFFGFQHLYFLINVLIKNNEISKGNILYKDKSQRVTDFENKLGVKFLNE